MPKVSNIEIFEELPVPRAVRIMAVPTIISQLIVLIYNMSAAVIKCKKKAGKKCNNMAERREKR